MCDPISIIGGAVGIGGALLGQNERSDAISDASRDQAAASDAAIQYQRETRDMNIERLQPFVDLQGQQANAFGEIFGFNPTYGVTPDSPQGVPVGQGMPTRSTAVGGPSAVNGGGFNDLVMRGIQRANGERFRPETASIGQGGAFMPTGGAQNPLIMNANATGQPTQPEGPAYAGQIQDGEGNYLTGQDAARQRYNDSMFNDVFRTDFERGKDAIDAGLSNQGLAFSSARLDAVEKARADTFGRTFNSYLSAMMGSPPSSATSETNAATSNAGNNISNITMQQGQNAAQSAYARGENDAGIFDFAGGLGGFAMGGGFG